MVICKSLFFNLIKSMSIIDKVMGIAQRNNAQVYMHNGLIPIYR